MIRKIILFSFFPLTFQAAKAANGDTTRVTVFDKMHMNRYGNFDKKALFPANLSSQRIWMKYIVGCIDGGQCEWDYTNTLYLRQHTGTNDSTLKQAPSFKVNGQVKDSLHYSLDTTWVSIFNSSTRQTDSTPSTTLTLIRFLDTGKPLVPTDTLKVWPVLYYRYTFDTSGKKTDSSMVPSQHVIRLVNTPYYSVFEKVNNFELGGIITPYAKAGTLPRPFNYSYVFDVTDYASMLKDSVEIRINYSGYSFGFSATVIFEMIEGTPAREVVKIENVYSGYFAYGNVSNPIENNLPAKTFTVDPIVKYVKLKTTLTGHGMENNEGCSEFCSKKIYLKLNNNQFAERAVWKNNCGHNAIINQGGTWVFDRANWCPGEQVESYEYELNTQPGNHTIDMDFEPFTANGNAGYAVDAQLIHYKECTLNNDAAIEEILWPGNNWQYSRQNPICDNARVVLKNFGKNPLTAVTIKYQSGGKTPVVINWAGNLKHNASEKIDLPFINWDASGTNFSVWTENPNNNADENLTNDKKITFGVQAPVVLPYTFIVEVTTNKRPLENSWTIRDQHGKLRYSKSFSTATTLHRDTITLGHGCFTFNLIDSGGDGLSFWYNQSTVGTGGFRLAGINPYRVLKTFNPDFGSFTTLNFQVNSPLGNEEQLSFADAVVYPNPARDMLFVDLNQYDNEIKTYSLVSFDGKELWQRQTTDASISIEVEQLPKGMMVLKVSGKDFVLHKKLLLE